ncbi:MAG TPA: OmpA family protein [Steroidobacteraceae bacterium]|jgi:outer membrane protein OmpA-like peptidoglycan-associated protein|nr:OmpA family protein [Steroidobacteraceae bacterium]
MGPTLRLFTLGILAHTVLLVSTVQAEQNCALGQRYVELAHDRQHAAEFDDAVTFLKRALDACPSYEVYQTLGDLQAQSPQREDQARAVEAFVAAYQLASTDSARARSLLSYARLLNQDGDPTNAYPIIKNAQALDPTSGDIARLSSQVEHRVNNPTKESISRGLWNSLYKPLTLASASSAGGSTRPLNLPDKAASPVINQQPATFVPINFETGTTLVDEQTRLNIAVLAHTLADSNHPNQRYVFVGHADIRGVELNNVLLSKRRAEAIYQSVTLLEPSLQGRIEITGKGSSEPIDLGNDDHAYRTNRRLQVLLR